MTLGSVTRIPPQKPPLFKATTESLIEDTKRLIQRSSEVQNEIVRNVPSPDQATFENVMQPLAQLEDFVAVESHIITFYQAVAPHEVIRSASSEAKKLLRDFSIETAARENLFVLIDGVYQKTRDSSLDAESRLLLEKEYKKCVSNGLSLPAGAKRDSFKDIKKKLSENSIKFQKNLNEESSGLWFTLEELDGVPEDVLERLEKGHQHEGDNQGKLRVTFQYPDYFPIMSYASNAETRKTLYLANENK